MTASTTAVLPRDVSRSRAALPMIAMGGVIVAALLALLVSLLRGEQVVGTGFDVARASVGHPELVELPDGAPDPAAGLPAPILRGRDLAGRELTAPTAGRPTVVLFVAHWCPHCRRALPSVQRWVDEGRKPAAVDLVAVATAMDDARPNHPSSRWLTSEGWSSPVIADSGNDASAAYGLSAFPFWVAVDADGRVVERVAGELDDRRLDALFAAAAAG